MPRIDWRLAVKALAGFLAGLALWVLLTPAYDRVIAAAAEKTLNLFERPAVTRLRPAEDNYVTVDRRDFDPRSKRPALALHDLTFNIILLTALFAASKRTFSDRNIGGFLVACAALALTHVLGTIAEVMSIYVAKLGMWSTVHYSSLERNVWGVANHFYRLVLMYAIAFALWWVFRDTGAAAVPAKKKRRK
ncbi:MAG TPA: exosortase H-associated membrane protein [Thermoanaerobaculia bacterium]|nr:exosortase H-associated membrane protein [Thermoanaerobaculia bacterium]